MAQKKVTCVSCQCCCQETQGPTKEVACGSGFGRQKLPCHLTFEDLMNSGEGIEMKGIVGSRQVKDLIMCLPRYLKAFCKQSWIFISFNFYTKILEITNSIWMAGIIEASKLQLVSAFQDLFKNVWLFLKFLLCCLCSACLVYE